jgi:short-subunit dehydrogenase involved in D-alanine esterification of teichoic acids
LNRATTGKQILITGGISGIGLAAAEALPCDNIVIVGRNETRTRLRRRTSPRP